MKEPICCSISTLSTTTFSQAAAEAVAVADALAAAEAEPVEAAAVEEEEVAAAVGLATTGLVGVTFSLSVSCPPMFSRTELMNKFSMSERPPGVER